MADAAEGPEGGGQEFSPGGQRSSEVHLLEEAEVPAADVEVEFAPVTPKEGEEEGDGGAEEGGDEEAVPEKLADDDGPKEHIFWRLFYTVFPKLRHVEDLRRVRANDPAFNRQYKYAGNVVITSKYNIITFLPLNLFEQFLRVANTYFLILLIIQLIPGVSSVPFYSTLLPLVGVLAITAVKDSFDDIKRHVSDFRINNRATRVLRDGHLVDIKWKQVRPGDVLCLHKDDFITADMLVLSSSEPNSLVYIETAELDGETNLKVRQPLPETAGLEDDPTKLWEFNGYVECEPPNNRLSKFVGTLTWQEQQFSLDNDKIVLRGCRLRNTKWMYGLVVYAGHDTKLVQNSGKTKFKRTQLDRLMNKMVLFILVFLGVLLLICLIGSWIFEAVYGEDFTVYVAYYNSFQDTPAELAWLQILSNLIVLNTFVPISLYVSVEVIRLGLSFLINWDRKMYYEPFDIPAVARTTTLNEELGQIEYIFSDKTGTLTQNIMTFLKCSIRGVKYGEVTLEDVEREQVVSTGEFSDVTDEQLTAAGLPTERIDFSWNPYSDGKFVFFDREFLEKCRGKDPDCDEFFKLLSLCHTVLPHVENGDLQYNAQSPDEAALVQAARNFGYVFKARSPFTMTLDVLNQGQEEVYEVLNILDFNNERKRMSVIVRYNERITLYCKGADTIVMALLSEESRELMKVTNQHLGDYAREGLRTLVLAKKELTLEEYTAWAEDHHAASIVQENRDQALDIVYSKIEQNMALMGATAIEDKLQDGVPETIANLAKANIKIWVLTGDKQETAINIGYSCKLLTEHMRVFIVDEDTEEGVISQLEAADGEIQRGLQRSGGKYKDPFVSDEDGGGGEGGEGGEEEGPTGPPFGIVINGHSLRYALREENKLQLLETAGKCQAVICCRVTPLQKKKVVDLVKKNRSAVTLAIGDGANDVGMIKAAHIGVGISGQEGQQAVLASDYSFGQFRYLERLLLVHGRWSYHRMTTFLRYFFYKNFAFTFSQFLFAFFCGFTAQTLYDATFIAVYNVIYTAAPIVFLAILDQDVDEENCYRYPQLYVAGQQNKNFGPWIFIRSLIKGIYVAIVFFFVLFGITFLNFYPAGYEWDYQSFGVAASGALVVIVNVQIALDTYHWNPIQHIAIWTSILSWLIVIPITSTPGLYATNSLFFYNGVAYEVIGSAAFWFYWPLATIIALMPTVCFRLIRLDLFPTLIDDVRLREKKEGKKLFKRRTIRRKSARRDRGGSVKRSGYAFSHEHGFAKLIMSGLGFGLKQDKVAEERRQRIEILISSAPSSRVGTPSPLVRKKPIPSAPVEPQEEAPFLPGGESPGSEPERPAGETITVDVHTTSTGPEGTAEPVLPPGAIPSPPPTGAVPMEEYSQKQEPAPAAVDE